jgi:hypothetical protein
LRRFLLHLLPPSFVRIRHFGFLAHRRRAALLPLCFRLLGLPNGLPPKSEESEKAAGGLTTSSSASLWSCPQCGGPMIILERLTAAEIYLRSPPCSLGRLS